MGTDDLYLCSQQKAEQLKYCHLSIFTCNKTVKFSEIPDKVCFNWSGMSVHRATYCNLSTEKKVKSNKDNNNNS